jgi:hypothetical protein
MALEYKVLSCPETGEDYLVIRARGRVDTGVIKEMFRSIAEITETAGACHVLLDMRCCQYWVTYFEIYQLFDEIKPGWHLLHNRIALLAPARAAQYDRLFMLSVYLLNEGVEADTFDEVNRAVRWLTKRRRPPLRH